MYNSVAEYLYDGDGNRIRQVDHTGAQAVTTTYANDNTGFSQVLLADDGSSQTANLFGLDLILQDDNSQTRFLLADGLGSVRQEITNEAIQIATTYEPYSNVLAQTGSSSTIYAFTGEQFGSAVSLDNGTLLAGARYEDGKGSNAGAVFAYENGSWGQQAKLTAVTGTSGDQFGFFVGLSGNTAVVGVPQDDDAGSAYTFVASGGGVEA